MDGVAQVDFSGDENGRDEQENGREAIVQFEDLKDETKETVSVEF